MSAAYTMFNVWLPAVLESRAKGDGDEAIKQALQEFVLYSGKPGFLSRNNKLTLQLLDVLDLLSVAILTGASQADQQVGAWMIQTRLGRRKSLAICTILTSLSTFAFIRVEQDWAVIVSSMFISAAATAMYAVLCKSRLMEPTGIHIDLLDGMTPETFGTSIRGTACGTSAALSRL